MKKGSPFLPQKAPAVGSELFRANPIWKQFPAPFSEKERKKILARKFVKSPFCSLQISSIKFSIASFPSHAFSYFLSLQPLFSLKSYFSKMPRKKQEIDEKKEVPKLIKKIRTSYAEVKVCITLIIKIYHRFLILNDLVK